MKDYLRLIDTSGSFDFLRRLQGKFEIMLLDARDRRRQGETIAELVEATEEVLVLEAIVARCREVLLLKKRQCIGAKFGRAKGRRKGAPAPPAPAGHAYRLLARCSKVNGPRKARFSCAGSADAGDARSENAVPVGPQTDVHPAKPAFFGPPDERISNENNVVGGIHYAH